MAALETIDRPTAAPDIPLPLPPMATDNTPHSRSLLKDVVDHPFVAAYWFFVNHAPVSGYGANLISSMIGLPPETMQYIRAHMVFKIFGRESLETLIQHFAPDISIEELERRIAAGSSKPPSQQFREAFSFESPFLPNPPTPAVDTAGRLAIAQLIYQFGLTTQPSRKSGIRATPPRGKTALEKRAWAFRHMAEILLHRETRERKPLVEYDRAKVFDVLAGQFETAYARRRNPDISWEEMVLTMAMTKASLALEEAPEVLEATAKFFSEAATGLARYVYSEIREPVDPDNLTQEISGILEGEIVDAAWGLLSVAERGSLKNVRDTTSVEITNAETILKGMRKSLASLVTCPSQSELSNFAAALERAINILELAHRDDIPPYTRSWLQLHFGASRFQEIFTPTINKDGVILRLDRDLTFLRSETNMAAIDDYPLFVALALRYPFHNDITVIDGSGTVRVIRTNLVREQLFQEPPNRDGDINPFISLVGDSSPVQTRPALGSMDNLPMQVFP
jgi:hypothetical protein